MAFDWKAVVGTLAPTIASTFGTPIMGMGVSMLLNAFGIDAKAPDAEKQLSDKVQSMTAEDLAKIKQAEQDFAIKMKELDVDLDKATMLDVQGARQRDVDLTKATGKNYRPDIMFLLAIFVISGLVWIVWQDTSLNEYVKGIFTLVLGRFLGYLDNIYNFEFGSTRSNKTKDETISNLSK